MYGGKKRRHSPPLNAVVGPQPDRPHHRRNRNVGRRTWPCGAGPPVSVPASGERRARAPAANVVGVTTAAQLPRWLRPATGPGPRCCSNQGEWTEIGRQILVVVRIVQGGCGGGRDGHPAGRSKAGGHHDDQWRILERFTHLAFQAAKVKKKRKEAIQIKVVEVDPRTG